MPHLIIEHSSNISQEPVISLQHDIQKIMSESEGGFTIEGCKTRSFSFDKYCVGALRQDTSSFIHITLKILSGRSVDVRSSLSNKILHYLKQFISDQNLSTKRCDISVDIVEMNKDTYSKDRIGE